MRAIVFGTAGHIDHGKTALVRALTGVDCDRLPEEKRRGITLVLGFAPMVDPAGEVEISFIDVPGHERLVHTMIAGAAGIDCALLVVAADEGVMPQTREHLDVLDVLGVRRGIVSLTKVDLVPPDDLIDVQRQTAAALKGGPLADAPIVPCSALTGQGVETLRARILDLARDTHRPVPTGKPFRLAVDRVFTMPGAGTIVTGTAQWGSVREGDELVALPSSRRVRVRGVQVHGQARPQANAGERIALRIAGAGVEDLPRGEQLLGAGPWRASRRVALSLRLAGADVDVAEGTNLWLHLMAGRTVARVERLATGSAAGGTRAILRLARAMFVAPGDRVVLRRVSPARTVGGGVILDSAPPVVRRREVALLDRLPEPWKDLSTSLGGWVLEAGVVGSTARELAARAGVLEDGVEASLGRLTEAGLLAVVPTTPATLIHTDALAKLRKRAREILSGAGDTGVARAELAARLVPAGGSRLREFVVADLRRAGVAREISGRVFRADVQPLADPLAARVAEVYREAGFEAPSPVEVASFLCAEPKTVDGLIRFLVERRHLHRVGGRWILHSEALEGVIAGVRSWGLESFEVGEFKERFGLTRKLAIPILEWLDSQRVTRREGERRRVLRPRTGTTAGG